MGEKVRRSEGEKLQDAGFTMHDAGSTSQDHVSWNKTRSP